MWLQNELFFEECLANRWYVSRRQLIGILFFLHINAGIKLHKVCVFMLSLLESSFRGTNEMVCTCAEEG